MDAPKNYISFGIRDVVLLDDSVSKEDVAEFGEGPFKVVAIELLEGHAAVGRHPEEVTIKNQEGKRFIVSGDEIRK